MWRRIRDGNPMSLQVYWTVRNVDMLNKLLDILNNRSVRKEQEMDSKRKATVEGSRNKKAK